MEKKFIVALALATGLAASAAFAGGPEIIQEPDYFSGFFVGGTGAFHMAGFGGSSSAAATTNIDATFTAAALPIVFSIPVTMFQAGTLAANNIDGNSYDGFYGVQVGVGKVFNHRWYAGFVGFGEWGSQTSTTVNNSNSANSAGLLINLTSTASSTSNTTVKISNDYGVAFKPGFLVAPRSMVYGKIGAIWSQLKVSNSFTGTSGTQITVPAIPGNPTIYQTSGQLTGSSSNSADKIALLLGVGFEQFIYRDFVTINVEYDYANYGSVTTSTPLTGTGTATVPILAPPFNQTVPLTGSATAQATANAKVSTLLAGLNFYFGSQWF